VINNKMGWTYSTHKNMRMHETVNSGNVYRRDHLGVIHIGGRMILKSILMEIICEGRTGFNQLRIGSGGGLL